MKIKSKLQNFTEKDKIVIKNALGAFAIKGLALLVSLFTMPAYMRYFSDDSILGVWFTILSVLTWVLNFDLGIGNGLRNQLTLALAKKDYSLSRELISSAYWMIGIAVIVLLVLGNILVPFVNWNGVFNVPESMIPVNVLSQTVKYAFLGIMLQFFFRLISSIIYALQKSALNNMVALATSVLQLIFALVAPCRTPAENLKMFSIAYIFCANLPLVLVTIWIFICPLKKCIPTIRYFKLDTARAVLSLGGIFFVCQILYMIIANTNEFFITQYTSPENVVEYQAYNKLFTLASTLFMLALTPIWSAVSKAIGENDYKWLKKLNRSIAKLAAIAIAAEFLIIPFLQILMNVWLGKETILVNYFYAFSFALYGSAMLYQSGVSTITNGTGRIKIQAICYAGGVIAKFIIIHVGIAITGSWIVVVLTNALILIPYCVIQQIALNKFLNSKCSTD